jgi:glucosamine 6-phosphate synthetase-like amidotransferase/phosphosugar isomerase protein
MCQLTAYIGDRPIAPLMLKAMELQEGYLAGQATGIGVLDPKGKVQVVKAGGSIARVKKLTNIGKLKGTTGIGHSRYSDLAREDPRYCTDAMAHPFTSDDGKMAMMHNGIITNFHDHWDRLKTAHKFKSYNPVVDWITDSEVAVHMIDELVKQGKGYGEALREVFPKLQGTVLLCLISESEPETIYLANRHQPCYIGIGKDEVMWCSSRIGLSLIESELKKVYSPPKNSLMKLTRGNVETEILDPAWDVPNYKLNKRMLKEAILRILSYAEIDFFRLSYALRRTDYYKCYGITKEKWEEEKKRGVDIVNPLVETLNELIEAEKIKQRIDHRMEGVDNRTPRFAYSLIK